LIKIKTVKTKTIETKTIAKLIPQNHSKTNTSKPKPYQNPNLKTKTSEPVLVLVHA
jgi:hypothetical protein